MVGHLSHSSLCVLFLLACSNMAVCDLASVELLTCLFLATYVVSSHLKAQDRHALEGERMHMAVWMIVSKEEWKRACSRGCWFILTRNRTGEATEENTLHTLCLAVCVFVLWQQCRCRRCAVWMDLFLWSLFSFSGWWSRGVDGTVLILVLVLHMYIQICGWKSNSVFLFFLPGGN